jgi:hypothetical protein
LCSTVDHLRRENGELRIEAARYRDVGAPFTRGASPASATVHELRLELADARSRIAELERALTHQRDVAATERRRADGARDALARSYRAWLDVTATRHA